MTKYTTNDPSYSLTVDPKDAGDERPKLFKPEEFDIFCNKITLESYIFHTRPIAQDIAHLEYDPNDHSITIYKKDGDIVDLGAKLQWLVRPYFTKSKEIAIVQTKDGEVVDGFMVPLYIRPAE